MVEAAEQLTRALDQLATLPATPTLRREQICQCSDVDQGLCGAGSKGGIPASKFVYRASEGTRRTSRRPTVAVSVLYGFWVANSVAFNGDAVRELAGQFLALADKQGATVPRMIGHRVMGMSLLNTGDIVEGRAHLDRAITLYEPARHIPARDALWPRHWW
jgi:hypothetical protein